MALANHPTQHSSRNLQADFTDGCEHDDGGLLQFPNDLHVLIDRAKRYRDGPPILGQQRLEVLDHAWRAYDKRTNRQIGVQSKLVRRAGVDAESQLVPELCSEKVAQAKLLFNDKQMVGGVESVAVHERAAEAPGVSTRVF